METEEISLKRELQRKVVHVTSLLIVAGYYILPKAAVLLIMTLFLILFLEIEFVEEMLQPQRFGSSYKSADQINQGIDKSSLERWRSSISGFTAGVMDLLHPRAMRILGYADD